MRFPSGKHPSLLHGLRRLAQMQSDPLGIFVEDFPRFGDLVEYDLRPFLPRTFMACRPEHVQHVLQKNNRNYRRSPFYAMLEPVLGKGLVTNDGPSWLAQRRLMQPAFHRRRLAHLVGAMEEACAELVARWRALPSGSELDLASEMNGLTLAIAARTLFHVDVSESAESVASALEIALLEFDRRTSEIVRAPEWAPTRRNRLFHGAIADLDEVVLDIIDQRRHGESEADDLLGMLMDARDEESGEGMSDKQLRDEVMTLLIAGHETTSNLLVWTLRLLADNPAVLVALREEVERVLPANARPDADNIRALELTRRVLDEALRLYPPAWMIDRVALEDDTIGDVEVPAGSLVLVAIWYTHRHPALWEDPLRFDPERFTPERSQTRHKYAFVPFGGGPHLCIGLHFAMMEAIVAIASIVRAMDWTLVDPDSIALHPSVTLRPAGPVRIALSQRAVRDGVG